MTSCWININDRVPEFDELVEVIPNHDENDDLSCIARLITIAEDPYANMPPIPLFKKEGEDSALFLGVTHWRPITKPPETK